MSTILEKAEKAAKAIGLAFVPAHWKKAIKDGWIIQPTSCMCGGDWAWLKPRPSGAHEMVGCVCHTDLTEYGYIPNSFETLTEQVSKLNSLLQDPHPGLSTWKEMLHKRGNQVYEVLFELGMANDESYE
jgi:hypothetical protein